MRYPTVMRAAVAAAAMSLLLLGSGARAQPTPQYSQTQVFSSFTKAARSIDISATTSSSRQTLTAAPVAIVYNTGSVAAFVELGSNTVVANATTSTFVPPGSCVFMNAVGATSIAGVTASGTATLEVVTGTGNLGSCAGGASSGGGGGSVTQGTSPWVDNITQWSSVALGAPSNYGTSPGAVTVPGVNAYVTNNVAVIGPTADGVAASTNPVLMAGTTDGTATGLVAVPKIAAGGVVSVDGSASTQPVSAVSLPLPSGAATATKQDSIIAAINASAVTLPLPVTGEASTSGSTTITLGGTAQNLFSSTVPTNGWEVCNPDASEDAWASDVTTAAANATGSYRLGPNGGCYSPPTNSLPIQAVSVFAATTGHKLSARRW